MEQTNRNRLTDISLILKDPAISCFLLCAMAYSPTICNYRTKNRIGQCITYLYGSGSRRTSYRPLPPRNQVAVEKLNVQIQVDAIQHPCAAVVHSKLSYESGALQTNIARRSREGACTKVETAIHVPEHRVQINAHGKHVLAVVT